jgi:hypothetical protein
VLHDSLSEFATGLASLGVRCESLEGLKKLSIADRYRVIGGCSWFIPGYSAESFLNEVWQVAEFECEIGLHRCMHEGTYQPMVQQSEMCWRKHIDVA